VKSQKAKGNQVTTYTVSKINELEPLRFETEPEETESEDGDASQEVEETVETEEGNEVSQNDILDEITGQMNLFK
jgi:topoisomerase-4 subunit A